MVNEGSSEASDAVLREAERRGLARALSLAPKAVCAAIERAGRALPVPPSGALTEPAGAFDPAAHANDR